MMKNKETLEEAAERYCLINNIPIGQMIIKTDRSCEFETPITMFIVGAKLQAERMYSDAIEFGKWLDENTQQREYYPMSAMTMEELFEQFKKK